MPSYWSARLQQGRQTKRDVATSSYISTLKSFALLTLLLTSQVGFGQPGATNSCEGVENQKAIGLRGRYKVIKRALSDQDGDCGQKEC